MPSTKDGNKAFLFKKTLTGFDLPICQPGLVIWHFKMKTYSKYFLNNQQNVTYLKRHMHAARKKCIKDTWLAKRPYRVLFVVGCETCVASASVTGCLA
jgi:hypothetical protein